MNTAICMCGCGQQVTKPNKRWCLGHNPHHHRRKVFQVHTIRGKARWYVGTRSAGRVEWARIVMQNHLGRELLPGEVVDHENGDSTDDRIDNLRLYASHSEHMREEFRRGRLHGLALGPAASAASLKGGSLMWL